MGNIVTINIGVTRKVQVYEGATRDDDSIKIDLVKINFAS